MTGSEALSDFCSAIAAAGLTPPEHVEADGELHRFATNGKRDDDSGWYVLHGDGIPAGAFGCWRKGVSENWRAEIGRRLTAAEETVHRKRVEAMRKARKDEEQRRHAQARERATRIWDQAIPAGDHPYLQRKHVKAHGARVHESALVLPLRDIDGTLHSLQFISADGDKKFLKDGRVSGCYYAIGEIGDPIVIAEGFATAASVYEATGYGTVAACSAGNLEPVARALRAKHANFRMLIAGDNDESRTGQEKAQAATKAVGGVAAIPSEPGDWNDFQVIRGAVELRKRIDAALERPPTRPERFPRVWLDDVAVDLTNDDLVKGIIGRRSFVVIYGPSGEGKTFFTIDLTHHVAGGLAWRGRRVPPQTLVVYVAAEAGITIVKRFAAGRDRLFAEGREGRIPLAIVTRGVNLLHLGDVEAFVDELRVIAAEVGMPVGLVVFDTYSRSTPGGKEDAEDTSESVAVADRLRDELGATTAFVHHSGKDAGKGARGHSGLCAAADTVIQVSECVATVEKARDGTTGEQFPFRLDIVHLGEDSDGDPVTTCVVVPTAEAAAVKPKATKLSGVAAVALQALREAADTHGKVMAGSSTIPKGVRAVEIAAWRDRFALRYGTDGKERRDGETVRKAFVRGREALLKAVAIGISDPFAWVVD